VTTDIGPERFNIIPGAVNILAPSRNAEPANCNIGAVSSNIAPQHCTIGPTLWYSVTMKCNIASMLCNIALALHTPMPETSPLGPRFICTAATLRGSRVLIGDSFAAWFGVLALMSFPHPPDKWNTRGARAAGGYR